VRAVQHNRRGAAILALVFLAAPIRAWQPSQASDARSALEEAVCIDEHTMGPTAAQTVADVEALAAVSELRLAEPLWKRAAASPDGAVGARGAGPIAGEGR
jgi:hypothetical protein